MGLSARFSQLKFSVKYCCQHLPSSIRNLPEGVFAPEYRNRRAPDFRMPRISTFLIKEERPIAG
jgi:hypothetical protein